MTMALTDDLLAAIAALDDSQLYIQASAAAGVRDGLDEQGHRAEARVLDVIVALFAAERRRRGAEWKAKERDLQSERVEGWWGDRDVQ